MLSSRPKNSDNLFQGEYRFSTRFQKSSEQNTTFNGTISFNNSEFHLKGIDHQQLPWKQEPLNQPAEEKGTYRIIDNTIHFESPQVMAGGWSFSGDFLFFTFDSQEEVMKKIGTQTIQYHLLEKDSHFILLTH